MTDLLIGSQEWRHDHYYDHGIYEFGQGFTVLATRCGITAPGRSAGSTNGFMLDLAVPSTAYPRREWMMGGTWYLTRAEAAAAAYAAWYREATSNMPESTRNFWADAYKYCR